MCTELVDETLVIPACRAMCLDVKVCRRLAVVSHRWHDKITGANGELPFWADKLDYKLTCVFIKGFFLGLQILCHLEFKPILKLLR